MCYHVLQGLERMLVGVEKHTKQVEVASSIHSKPHKLHVTTPNGQQKCGGAANGFRSIGSQNSCSHIKLRIATERERERERDTGLVQPTGTNVWQHALLVHTVR